MGILLFFITNPVGRLIAAVAIALTVGFWSGYEVKSNLCESETLKAIISKQKIDLEAANDTAAQANAVADELADADDKNQEMIRELQNRQPGACVLDPADADRLRQLR